MASRDRLPKVPPGLLIRHNLTRRVAYGTLLRLTAMTLTAVIASRVAQLGGIRVGAAALSAGVLVEALASRLMARRVVSRLLRKEHRANREDVLTFGEILSFYTPLALTSLVVMAVQPLVTFFMGQSRFALESLATLPVIHGLTLIFRSLGLSYQEVGIALLGDRREHYESLRNFGFILALSTSTTLGVIAFSPLSTLWFHHVSGLSVELTRFSLLPTRIFTLLPALTVLLSLQRLAARAQPKHRTDHVGGGCRGHRRLGNPDAGDPWVRPDRCGRGGRGHGLGTTARQPVAHSALLESDATTAVARARPSKQPLQALSARSSTRASTVREPRRVS